MFFCKKASKEIFEGLTFENITKKDIMPLTAIMKRAFDEDYRLHFGKGTGGPDGYDNGEFIRKWYFHKGVKAYKISKDGVLIGAIALWINKNNVNYLGNVFVDSNLQDKGIGLKIWRFVEQKYPNTLKWKTDTPLFSKRNHHFYINKCGFKLIEITNPDDIEKGQYILEKDMKNK